MPSDPTAPHPALPGRFDAARFKRLLELVGPAMAPVLLAQLTDDLTRCQSRLATAADDWDAMRTATHDIVALSGSCGADTLHDLAQTLNQAAHRKDRTALAALSAAIEAELRALLALIRATTPDGDLPW